MPINDLTINKSDNDSGCGSGSLDVSVTDRIRLKKNPDVDTSFLPDRDRDEVEHKIREELRQNWFQKQEKLKNEDILVIFSYWDGSGHRREISVKKGL